MEWLKSMLARVFFIFLKRNFQNNACIQPNKKKVFFRSCKQTCDSTFEFIEEEFSIAFYVQVFSFLWFRLFINIKQSVWSSSNESFGNVGKINQSFNREILSRAACQNSFKISIYGKIKQISRISSNNKPFLKNTIRCEIVIFFIEISSGRLRLFQL